MGTRDAAMHPITQHVWSVGAEIQKPDGLNLFEPFCTTLLKGQYKLFCVVSMSCGSSVQNLVHNPVSWKGGLISEYRYTTLGLLLFLEGAVSRLFIFLHQILKYTYPIHDYSIMPSFPSNTHRSHEELPPSSPSPDLNSFQHCLVLKPFTFD